MTRITCPVKDAIKALGGKWDADAKAWMVPDAKAADAPGWTVDWCGEGNTDADGGTVEDIELCPPAAQYREVR